MLVMTGCWNLTEHDFFFDPEEFFRPSFLGDAFEEPLGLTLLLWTSVRSSSARVSSDNAVQLDAGSSREQPESDDRSCSSQSKEEE